MGGRGVFAISVAAEMLSMQVQNLRVSFPHAGEGRVHPVDGVSFTLDGHQLRWQRWSMRLGFTPREAEQTARDRTPRG